MVVAVAEHRLSPDEPPGVAGFIQTALGALEELPFLALGEDAAKVGFEVVLGGLEVEDALGGGHRHPGLAERGADGRPVAEVGGAAEPLHLDDGNEVDAAGGDVVEESLHDRTRRRWSRRSTPPSS